MPVRLVLVMLLAPKEPPWATWRWLAGVDLRVLGAALALAAIFAAWGVWSGWRSKS